MKFWIVTPSYNQLQWLKLCILSVADQTAGGEGNDRIEVHHHVQDACSSDGTREFLAEYQKSLLSEYTGYTFSYASELDDGMYDAINRGWKCASGNADVIAHLNCDEQYLPEALQNIAAFFKQNPHTDVVFADMIVVDSEGGYICHRRALYPYKLASLYYCAGFTATTFHRASVTRDRGIFFDPGWRNVGDKVWYNALHSADCKFSILHSFVSVFTDTGENLNWSDEGRAESARYRKEFLRGGTLGGYIFTKVNALRRYFLEFFEEPPHSYMLYDKYNHARKKITIENPTGLWHKKQ